VRRWSISPRAISLSALLTLLIGLACFQVTTRTTSGFLVWSDGLAYFLYARALVLEGHSDITEGYDALDKLYPADPKSSSNVMDSIRVNASRNPDTGRIFTPWPIGAGVVMAPFYALGYATERLVAPMVGRPPNSFGLIPQYFFGFGSLVFGLLGFWATLLCCRKVAETKRAYFAALGTILGGPAVFYIFINPTMAHAMSFGLVALLTLWWWRQWSEGTRPASFAILGLLLGVLISIRLQNVIFGILLAALLLLEVRRSSWFRALVIGLCGALAASVPLLVQILHSSLYGPPKAALSLQAGGLLMIGNYPLHLKSPYFFDVLFSCRHGAFYWAPVLALGLIGLIWATRRDAWPWVFLITIFCHVYLIGGLGISDLSGRAVVFDTSNWNEHWKGGTSFGMRYLTECTPFFAVGLTALMQATGKRTTADWWWRAALLLFVVWNGLLMLAYGLNTVSRSYCVTYVEMATGVGQALARGAAALFGG
jgi:hypothetical protein